MMTPQRLWYTSRILHKLFELNKVKATQKLIYLKEKNMFLLSDRSIFDFALQNNKTIAPIAQYNPLVNNSDPTKKTLLIITDPTCGKCRELHKDISNITDNYNVNLIFAPLEGDSKGEFVALQIITIYEEHGWDRAHRALTNWFENRKVATETDITSSAQTILNQHRLYCQSIELRSVPLVAVNNHLFPFNIYNVTELKFLM